jgi:hypothetical protein
MEIHKPKPVRDWREFVGEIGIIVIGVLIALLAEQAAEALHSRHIIAEAEQSMRAELVDDDLPQAYVRMAMAPCLTAQLGQLRQALDARMPAAEFHALAMSYVPPLRSWDSESRKAMLASSAAARMTSDRLLGWAQAYTMIPIMQTDATAELALEGRLRRTRLASGPWTPARADEVSDIIDDLKFLNRGITGEAYVLAQSTAQEGMRLTPAVQAQLLAETRKAYGACVVTPDLTALDKAQGQVLTPEQRTELRRRMGAGD